MVTLKGNGEILLASVIGGTTARPFLDEVCVIIVWMAFVRVEAKAMWAFSRSGYRNKLHGTLMDRICVGNSPFSFVGCHNSAFMTLITWTLLWCRRSTEMTNAPLFPRSFFLPDREPVFLRFLFRDCYDDLLRSQYFGKSSKMLSLARPRLLKPPSSLFQNVSTFSSISCSVSWSETAGWRRISNGRQAKLTFHTLLSRQEFRKFAVW